MTTHSSNLTWRIPWTEEPGGLQSIELQISQRGLKQFNTEKHFTRIIFCNVHSVLKMKKLSLIIKVIQARLHGQYEVQLGAVSRTLLPESTLQVMTDAGLSLHLTSMCPQDQAFGRCQVLVLGLLLKPEDS